MKNLFSFLSNSSGNVVVEFALTAVALFVPISYLALAATQVANGYLEVQNAAKAGARIFASSADETSGKFRAKQVVLASLENSEGTNVLLSCNQSPCLTPDGIVKVEVIKQIKLNLPSFLGFESVQVTGAQAEVVQDVR